MDTKPRSTAEIKRLYVNSGNKSQPDESNETYLFTYLLHEAEFFLRT
jgi:hypothetical protein